MAHDLIPISPAAHYLCGGIRVNLRGETGIKNLFAFGEVAGTGVHGANRLASNSLLEALVFSDRILKNPHQKNRKPLSFPTAKLQKLSLKEHRVLRMLRRELRRVMWEKVGIVRSRKSLVEALRDINRLTDELQKIPVYAQESIELKNMLTAAHLITQAALKRRKSLGCHYTAFSKASHTRSIAS